VSDVSLDPLHFGGGNTTYEALAVGTPVVTLPGPYLRSRISRALYQKMAGNDSSGGGQLEKTPAPVAASAEDYVGLAVELAHAGAWRGAGLDRRARGAAL
jgi:predicted O-linked N-acetylglucosamine transferase (SPINDLY family)